MLKTLLFCGAACAILSEASAVRAQQSPPRGAQETTQLGEIVITAQKVRTNAQTTPLDVQVVGGGAITTAGVNDAKDLDRLVPALAVQPSGGTGSSFFIRGVGNANGNANTDNGIAVSLDQVYFSRQYGPDLSFYDIDRIEVLKGPQGTLYGRNSTGGAINIISTKPTLDEFKGYARIEVGNYGEVRSNAAVNLPLSDTLAARVAVQTNMHSGYLSDGYDDNDTYSVRGHLLWKPTSKFSLLLTAEYAHGGGKGQEGVIYTDNHFLNTGQPYLGGGSAQAMANVDNLALKTGTNQGSPGPGQLATAPGSCYPGCLPPGFVQASTTAPHPYQVTNSGFSDTTVESLRADMEWDLGFANLSVIPGLLNTYYDTLFFLGPPPFYNRGSARQHSLEVRLASPQDQRFSWIAGVFGQEEKQSFEFIGAFGFPIAYQGTFEPDVEDKAGGVFAQTDFKITPTLSLTTGIRYSAEWKTNRNAIADNAGDFLMLPFGPGGSLISVPGPNNYNVAPINKENASAPTYRAGLDWRATPDNFLYVSFATGFHSGGVQLGQPPVRPLCKPNLTDPAHPQVFINSVTGCDAPGTYLPEHLDAYTIGSKNRFFENRLQVNVEAYDWEYTDLQVGTLGLSNPGQTNQVVVNAGSARIRGVDVEARAQITSADDIGVTANYNQSKYGKLTFFDYIVGLPFPPTVNNLTGQPFVNAPDLTLRADYRHVFELPNGARLIPTAAVQYSSVVRYSDVPLETQRAYYKLDMDVTYHAPRDRFQVQLFVRNLNNAATLAGGAGQDSTTNQPFVFVAPPRTFGASLQVNF